MPLARTSLDNDASTAHGPPSPRDSQRYTLSNITEQATGIMIILTDIRFNFGNGITCLLLLGVFFSRNKILRLESGIFKKADYIM